jgi:regulator of sigma E protease
VQAFSRTRLPDCQIARMYLQSGSMNSLMNAVLGFADGIGPFLILLGLLIFVHELGHFLVAKFFGVRVEVFSLGFGRKILSYRWGDTNYCVSLIPLGGYVKMFGDDPSKDIPETEKRHSFLHKPVSQRIAIVLAGPVMNLVFAFFLFILIATVGEPQAGNYIGDVTPGTRAFDAGFRSGDKILKINEQTIDTWGEAKTIISASPNQKLHFDVEREDSVEKASVAITPVLGDNDNILSHQSQVGVIEGLDNLSYAAMIGIHDPTSPAAKSGLKSLDVVTKVNDREVYTWRDLERFLREDLFKGRTPIKLQVLSYGISDKPKPHEVLLNTDQAILKLEKAQGEAGETVPRAMALTEIGIEPAQLYLWKVKRGSPAEKAGLKPGDRVTAINGEPVNTWTQVVDVVKTYNPDRTPLEFSYRRNEEELKAQIVPEMTELIDSRGKDERRFTVGIVSGFMQAGPRPVLYRADGIGEALSLSVKRTIETTGMVVMSIVRLIQGDVSAKNIGGIISIGRFANQSYEAGLTSFLRMMALISINLFLLNLLPVPVLDGGHLVFFSIEALQGAPLSMRKMEIAQQVGLVILMSLMAFALFNDISNWLNSTW